MPTTLLLPLIAQEQSTPDEGSGGSGLSGLMVPLLAILAIFYFVMIAPEKKQRRRREEMLGALKKGDKVMTTSGLMAVVAQVQEDVVTLQVADGVRMRFSRSAIQTILNGDDGGDSTKGA